jgi:hypothetical protein
MIVLQAQPAKELLAHRMGCVSPTDLKSVTPIYKSGPNVLQAFVGGLTEQVQLDIEDVANRVKSCYFLKNGSAL